MSDNLQALPNQVLVAIPQRYKQVAEGTGKIHLIAGEDNMRELIAQIQRGGAVRIETETDKSVGNLVRTGQVLSVGPLNDQMVLCAANNNKGYNTFADIMPVVEVGDTVRLDHSCLIDENEILPGIYRVPHSAIICVIEQNTFVVEDGQLREWLLPVGGYVLLSRVWAADVEDVEIEGRMRKVRYVKGRPNMVDVTSCADASKQYQPERMIEQIDVPPLPNEGVVAWVDAPLRGALNELHPGQRVLVAPGQALVESIVGTSYLCVRHGYVLAVKESKESLLFDSPKLTESEAKQFRELGTDVDWVEFGLPTADGIELVNSGRFWHHDGTADYVPRMIQVNRALNTQLPLNSIHYNA